MAAQGIQNLGHTLQQQKKMSICNIDDQELLFIALSIPFVAHTKKETERNDDRHSLAVPKRFFLYLLCCTYAARSQQASWRKWHLRFLIQKKERFYSRRLYTAATYFVFKSPLFFTKKLWRSIQDRFSFRHFGIPPCVSFTFFFLRVTTFKSHQSLKMYIYFFEPSSFGFILIKKENPSCIWQRELVFQPRIIGSITAAPIGAESNNKRKHFRKW